MSDFDGRSKPGSDSWRLCRGPANWFTFRCPDDVEVRQNQTLIEIIHTGKVSEGLRPAFSGSSPQEQPADDRFAPPSPPTLSIVTWWEDSASEHRKPSPDLALLFPQVVSLQPQPPLRTEVPNEVWMGLSRRPATGCWLARIFQRRIHYQWRLWTLRQGRLTIVATLQSADRRPIDLGFLNLCEQILSSLEVSQQPAWPPDVFMKNVLDLARQNFPLLQASVARGFSLRLGHSEIGLSNFYRMYLQQPTHFRRIVLPGLTTVVRMQELSPEQLLPTLDEVRERILPMLSGDDESRTEDRVRTAWVGGLSVGYVVDEAESYRFVLQQMLDSWSITSDELHDIALDNLRRYASENPLEVTMVGDDDDPRMLMPIKPDAYNSSRILDPGFHGRLRDLFGPELLIGVPNRDFFVAVTMKDRELIEQVRLRVNEDFATMHHPLTRRLLVVSADGVSEFCEG
ncbi:MAG: DUF1444 family protein [Planctomycetota bacterium]